MAVANLLLSMSVTMLIPTLPLWMTTALHFTSKEVGLIMGAFAVGLFLPGVFCSYAVQQQRRNMVFLRCVLLLGVSMILPMVPSHALHQPLVIGLWRLLQGALFGLVQMACFFAAVLSVLSSIWAIKNGAEDDSSLKMRYIVNIGMNGIFGFSVVFLQLFMFWGC
jgi:MFS family permease